MKPRTNRQRATALSRRLNMPPGQLLHVVALAGLEAIESTLGHRGKVTFPLAFETAGDIVPPLGARTVTPLPAVPGMPESFLIAPAPPETLPVYLPAAVALRLREMCEVASIEGGLDSFVSTIMEGTLELTAADVLIDLGEITDPTTITKLHEIQNS